MPEQKQPFLEKLMRERDRFELFLNRVGFTRRMTMTGVSGKWSVKDMLARLLISEQYIADRLNEIQQGETRTSCYTQTELDDFLTEFGYPDFGSPLLEGVTHHEWIVEKYKNASLEDLVAQEVQAFASIVDVLEALPDSDFHKHNLSERVADHTLKLYREHLRAIRQWLKIHAIQLKP